MNHITTSKRTCVTSQGPEMTLPGGSGGPCSSVVGALDRCGEERAESEGEALRSCPDLWS